MGMKYALGSLATDRFGRYLVTILFDMFFTVILFKYFYSMLVQALLTTHYFTTSTRCLSRHLLLILTTHYSLDLYPLLDVCPGTCRVPRINYSPLATYTWLLIAHHLLRILTTHYSLLATHYTHYSLLTTHCPLHIRDFSLDATPSSLYLLLTTHLLGTTYYSSGGRLL